MHPNPLRNKENFLDVLQSLLEASSSTPQLNLLEPAVVVALAMLAVLVVAMLAALAVVMLAALAVAVAMLVELALAMVD